MSGETPSPNPKEVLRNNNIPLPRKIRAINDTSPYTEISVDEIIEMPQSNLANVTLEKTIFLQDILEKKKQKKELKREHKKKWVLYDVKNIFVDAMISKF